MIEKERLKELIEQGATIWHCEYGKLRERELNKSYHINIFMNKEWLCKSYCDFDDDVKITHIAPFFEVFETREDAEWHKEFGCIERTERLELPTWEEFNGQKFVWFFDKDHKSCCLHYLGCSNQIFINVDGDVISIGDLTKENYTLACRKCVELFKGEKK